MADLMMRDRARSTALKGPPRLPERVQRRPTIPTVPTPLRVFGVVACAIVILAASVADPSGSGVPRTLFGIGITVYLHFIAYAGLAGAIGHAVLSADRRALLLAVIIATLYGAGIELLQGTLSHRTMAAGDGAINAVGAALGAACWWLIAPLFGAPRGSLSSPR
jgi:VanZ family protein